LLINESEAVGFDYCKLCASDLAEFSFMISVRFQVNSSDRRQRCRDLPCSVEQMLKSLDLSRISFAREWSEWDERHGL